MGRAPKIIGQSWRGAAGLGWGLGQSKGQGGKISGRLRHGPIATGLGALAVLFGARLSRGGVKHHGRGPITGAKHHLNAAIRALFRHHAGWDQPKRQDCQYRQKAGHQTPE